MGRVPWLSVALLGVCVAPATAAHEVGIWVCGMYDEDFVRSEDGSYDHHDNIGATAFADGGPPNPSLDGPNADEIAGALSVFAADLADGDADGDGSVFEGGGFVHAGVNVDGEEKAGAGTDDAGLGPQRACPFEP